MKLSNGHVKTLLTQLLAGIVPLLQLDHEARQMSSAAVHVSYGSLRAQC